MKLINGVQNANNSVSKQDVDMKKNGYVRTNYLANDSLNVDSNEGRVFHNNKIKDTKVSVMKEGGNSTSNESNEV